MIINIPDFILKELKKIKTAEAILLTGSRAIGKESKNSDWDFMVILKDNSPRWRKTFKVRNTWIELLYNNSKQIEKEFNEDLEEGRGVTTYMFATGKILFDNKDKTLKKLIEKAKTNWNRNPTKLSKEKINWISYDISTYIQDIEDCSHENKEAPLLINHAVNEFVNYYYRLGNIWLPRPKDRFQDIKKVAPKLFHFIMKIEHTDNWQNKANIAISIGKLIGKQYKLNLNGELIVHPKKETRKH